MRPPTAEDKHGANPPAVSRATRRIDMGILSTADAASGAATRAPPLDPHPRRAERREGGRRRSCASLEKLEALRELLLRRLRHLGRWCDAPAGCRRGAGAGGAGPERCGMTGYELLS